MITGLLYALVGFIEFLVGARFVLLLLGANPVTNFVTWIYNWSEPFVAPFNGIFGQSFAITTPGIAIHSVVDWSSLVALIVYGLIAGTIAGVSRQRRA